MPRGKTFDPEEKLDEALDLFWRQGCDAVSIQDLVDTLDLNRGSLYGTYGDKEQLWQRTLTRYCEQRRVHLAALFDDPTEPVLPRVRLLMLELANPNTELPRGCLIVNAITERTNDPATLDIAQRQINHVEDVLRKAFTRARASGEIPAASSATARPLPGGRAARSARLRPCDGRSPTNPRRGRGRHVSDTLRRCR